MPIEPQLSIQSSDGGPRRVIALEGEFDLASSPLAGRALEGLTSSNVVLDLRKVDFIDSSGLEMLVTQQAQFDEEGGSLVLLVDDTTIVQRLLVLARLADGFRIVRSIGDLD